MASCEVLGNDYDKPMQITVGASVHTFDSFECAMHALAPRCEQCGCRAVGTRDRGPGEHLLLRALCSQGGRKRSVRPRIAVGLAWRRHLALPVVSTSGGLSQARSDSALL